MAQRQVSHNSGAEQRCHCRVDLRIVPDRQHETRIHPCTDSDHAADDCLLRYGGLLRVLPLVARGAQVGVASAAAGNPDQNVVRTQTTTVNVERGQRNARRQRRAGLGLGHALLAGVLGMCGVAPHASADQLSAAERRGKEFWLALVPDCVIPAGESAGQLMNEAVSLLDSRDSQWRDDVGYDVVVACVYQARRLSPAERRALVDTLAANLRRGIGETGTDSVLLRSFSALDLSVLAALELDDPVLDDGGYRRLLDDALAYLCNERDLLGLVPGIGWIHATAHTADLLKFLARDRRFTVADQRRLLEAAWAKMTTPGIPVWTHAEEERLAAALLSVVRRTDFDPTNLDAWLARFVTLEQQVWTSAPPDAAKLAAAQNARRLLQSFFVLLSMPQPEPTPGQVVTQQRVLATLQSTRR